MKDILRIAAPLLFVLAACSGSSQQTSVQSPSATNCTATQFVANGTCYDSGEAACAALNCPSGCKLQETAPAVAACN